MKNLPVNGLESSLVPHAENLNDILKSWKEAGLEAVEVSEEDLVSEISITASKHTGEMQWESKKADGIRTLSMMALAMRSMFQEYLKDGGIAKLATHTPDTKIAIQLENNEVKMAYDQTVDPMAIKGLLMACLWKMIDKIDEGHPLDVFTGLLQFKINEEKTNERT